MLVLVFLSIPLLLIVTLLRRDYSKKYILAKWAKTGSQFASLQDGTVIHYQQHGNPDKPTLILLHGFMASLYDYDQWVEFLQQDLHIVCIDLPGMGLTGATSAGDYSSRAMAHTLNAFVEYMNLTKFSISGHSRGGSVAWFYTLLYPHKVEKLIVNAASGFEFEQGSKKSNPIGFKIAEHKYVKRILKYVVKYIGAKFIIKNTLHSMVYNRNDINDEWVQRSQELLLHNNNRQRMLNLRPFKPDHEMLKNMHNITAPTLILWGENDNIVPLQHAAWFKQKIPHAQSIIYPHTGHYVQIEQAHKSATAVLNFIQED